MQNGCVGYREQGEEDEGADGHDGHGNEVAAVGDGEHGVVRRVRRDDHRRHVAECLKTLAT